MREHKEFLSSHIHRKRVRITSAAHVYPIIIIILIITLRSHCFFFPCTGGDGDGADLGADFVETRGDGGGGSITSENVAFEHPRVFVPRHVGKIPATQKPGKREHVTWEGR